MTARRFAPLWVATVLLSSALGPLATHAAPESSPAAASPAAINGPSAAGPAPVTISPATGANLNISPKRISLDRTHRTGTIFVFNQGAGPGTFDISLIDRVMLTDGEILPLADAVAKPETRAIAERVKSAQSILQVSPHRITLNPGQGQTVRLRIATMPTDPNVGELRTHLTISSLPPRESGTTAEAAAAATAAPGQLRIQINALLGLSVAVIVRLTEPDIRAEIVNARVVDMKLGGAGAPSTPVLVLDIARQGANSLFGNIEVRSESQAQPLVLGVARGVGVYPEIDHRTVQIPLSRAPAPGEHLLVTFTDDDTSPGKLLARIIL